LTLTCKFSATRYILVAENLLPLASYSNISTATSPPAVWKSDKAPATRPALDLNTSNSALFQVLEEPLWVVALVACGNKVSDSGDSIFSESCNFVKSSDVSAFDPGPLPIFIGCPFSMMNAFLTIELNPSFFELLPTATRFVEEVFDHFLVMLPVNFS